MTNKDKWNTIVAFFQKNESSREDVVQCIWECLIHFVLGYALNEISPQKPIQMGSNEKRMDIVIQKDKKDAVVIELKQHTMPYEKGERQLLSYLNQLKLVPFGILVCEKLYIYDFDFKRTNEANQQNKVEIEFRKDNSDGENFVELFSKETFDETKIREWIQYKLEEKERKKAKQQQIQKMKNQITEETILQALKAKLIQTYGDEALVNEALKDYQFPVPHHSDQTVKHNTNPLPPKNNPANHWIPPSPIKTQYENYLAQTGKASTTITNYVRALKIVLNEEHFDWEDLKKNINDEFVAQYYSGGSKSDIGKELKGAAKASLAQFLNFVNSEC